MLKALLRRAGAKAGAAAAGDRMEHDTPAAAEVKAPPAPPTATPPAHAPGPAPDDALLSLLLSDELPAAASPVGDAPTRAAVPSRPETPEQAGLREVRG